MLNFLRAPGPSRLSLKQYLQRLRSRSPVYLLFHPSVSAVGHTAMVKFLLCTMCSVCSTALYRSSLKNTQILSLMLSLLSGSIGKKSKMESSPGASIHSESRKEDRRRGELRKCQRIKVSKYQSKVQGTLILVLYR